jgi:hypothetical protein
MNRAIVLAAVGLAASPAAAGPCLEPGLLPMVISPLGATIDQFGGVVVAAVPFRGGEDKDPVVQPWEFVEGKQRTKAKVTVLAPGLAVYAPQKPQAELVLEAKVGRTVGRVKFQFQNTDDMPVDAAPRPTLVVQAKQSPMSSDVTVTASLAEAPPAGTIAVLVRSAGSKTATARSWNRLYDIKTKTIKVYDYNRCEPVIPGTVATKAGDKIELAWLDAEGHVSLWSQAIEVKADK